MQQRDFSRVFWPSAASAARWTPSPKWRALRFTPATLSPTRAMLLLSNGQRSSMFCRSYSNRKFNHVNFRKKNTEQLRFSPLREMKRAFLGRRLETFGH
jgi:hypothetical protein